MVEKGVKVVREFLWSNRRRLLGAAVVCVVLVAGLSVLWQGGRVAEAAVLDSHPGLVGWWRFDEGDGVVAEDSSGFGNDGTVYGATKVDGKYGKALSFDGVDDYVLVPHSASLNVIDAITIGVWVKPSGAGTYKYICAKPSYGRANPPYLVLWPGGLVEFACPDGTSYGNLFSIGTVPSDTWTHIACTYSKTEGKQKIFINGALDNSRDVDYNLQQNTAGYYVGAGSHGQRFNGILDEVRIYNRALSASEIETLTQKGPDYSSRLLAKVPKGTTQFIVTLSWQGDGSINVTIESPSKTYTEDMLSVYQRTSYSTSGSISDMLNIKRVAVSVISLSSNEDWYVMLESNNVENYRITVEVQK